MGSRANHDEPIVRFWGFYVFPALPIGKKDHCATCIKNLLLRKNSISRIFLIVIDLTCLGWSEWKGNTFHARWLSVIVGPRGKPVHHLDRSLAIFGGMLNVGPLGEAGRMDNHVEPTVTFCWFFVFPTLPIGKKDHCTTFISDLLIRKDFISRIFVIVLYLACLG